MAEVTETHLPGVGVRYEFTTADGTRLGVIHHHGGRREIVVYDHDDPDRAGNLVTLTPEDSRTMSDLLGATQVTEVVQAVQQRIEGLTLEWIEIPERASMVGRTIGDGELRTRTGASVVAVLHGEETVPAPGPDHVFREGDVVVAVGTAEGLELLRQALRS
ncbi:MAG: cation:proton antiporter regulatory subunit [Acidimicrobiia bacterium]